jgi:hypothetical protein
MYDIVKKCGTVLSFEWAMFLAKIIRKILRWYLEINSTVRGLGVRESGLDQESLPEKYAFSYIALEFL